MYKLIFCFLAELRIYPLSIIIYYFLLLFVQSTRKILIEKVVILDDLEPFIG